jgi:hypothetical protein
VPACFIGNAMMEERGLLRVRRWTLALLLVASLGWVFRAQAAGPGVGLSAEAATSEQAHWAFQALAPRLVPRVHQAERVRTAIDAFVLARLEERGLGFAPEAGRATLARRACLDLLGVPPPPDLVDAFVAEDRPGAYERLLDRLLASLHYGERWGRHWLDVAGFSEIYEGDEHPTVYRVREEFWRYRDYVIASFNADKPYDRFLTEQLAGDALVDWRHAPRFTPEVKELLTATGFLRTAADFTTAQNFPRERYDVLHGTIETVTSGVLGLTVACARCHDHKFDPIPQRDYYRLMALLTPAYNLDHWTQANLRWVADVGSAEQREIDRGNAAIDRQVRALKDEETKLRQGHEARLREKKLSLLPEPIRADTRAALETPKEKRDVVQAYLAAKLGPQLQVSEDEVSKALSLDDRNRIADLGQRRAEAERQQRSYGKIHALFDVGPAPTTHLLKRGNLLTPGPAVEPGFLAALGDADLPPGTKPHERRLAFARWLTRPDTPAGALVARVLVNRVWLHHFGRGIVPSAGNFGRTGAAPTHRELLDWLAGEFIRSGWSIKALHRQIMTSTVYRQASHRSEAEQPGAVRAEAIDPDNVLLWRMPLRRLDAEMVRDAILTASGALDPAAGGPSVPTEARPDGLVVVDEKQLPRPTAKWRRSVYLFARRNYHLTLLNVFDAPLMTGNCTQRTQSVVPLQALTLMNNAFVWEQAELMARRVARELPDAPAARQVELAFRLTLARRPTPDQTAACVALLAEQTAWLAKADPRGTRAQAAHQALANLCRMLFNTNEFLYIE